MHVAVLGAGITGVTTAYYLAESGHSVTVFDRAAEAAAATSHANGAQLSYSYTDSLARPEFLPKIPSLVAGLDPAIRVGVLHNLGLLPWGIRFLGQCTSHRAEQNTVAVLKIALRSKALIEAIQAKIGLGFSFRTAGKLVLLPGADDIAGARDRAAVKREFGCDTHIVDRAEAIRLEPAIGAMRTSFAGAIYSPDDQVGDCRQFAREMLDWLCRHRPVDVRFGSTLQGLELRDGVVAGVLTAADSVPVDAAVVCLGPWSGKFVAPLGIRLPIYPVRGYSVTLPFGAATPGVSVTALGERIVFSRLDNVVRIAGFADFLGYRTDCDPKRRQKMLSVARQVAPDAADYDAPDQRPWAGIRPVTLSSQPVVGQTRVPGLFLNAGHGVLGWTLACATGHDVADAVGDTVKTRKG